LALVLEAFSHAHAVAEAPKSSAVAPPKSSAVAASKSNAVAQREAEQALLGHDPETIRQALDTLAKLGSAQAATAVAARLHRGLPPQLVEPAIAALVTLNKQSAGPVLLELTVHRSARIRQQAVAALGALKLQSAQPVLLRELDDPSPEVRVAAVEALGKAGNARAVPGLLHAADHGIAHAMDALGAIASPQDLKAILEHAAPGDLAPVKPALQAMLERADFPLQGKLSLIQEVAKLSWPAARVCLVEWLDAWKKSGDPRLRQALFGAIKHIDQAAKSELATAEPGAATRTLVHTTEVRP
jgi:hypothetical protein